jgi:hypothetical protein
MTQNIEIIEQQNNSLDLPIIVLACIVAFLQ